MGIAQAHVLYGWDLEGSNRLLDKSLSWQSVGFLFFYISCLYTYAAIELVIIE